MNMLSPKYPGVLPVDEVDHALDLIRVVLAIYAYEADPTNVSHLDMTSIGCVLTYAVDVLQPVREQLNRDIAKEREAAVIRWPGFFTPA